MNKEIRALYTEDAIRVYQAYNENIANEAIKRGTFGIIFMKYIHVLMVRRDYHIIIRFGNKKFLCIKAYHLKLS